MEAQARPVRAGPWDVVVHGARAATIVIVIVLVASACARRPARDESPLPTADGLTQSDIDAYESARDLVCPGRAEDGLAGLSPITRADLPVGRWHVPASTQVDALEDLVAATPCNATDHAEILVRAVGILARAEWELVGRCLRGSLSRNASAVRRETAAIHEMLPALRFVRQRAEAHCTVLAASHPEAATRSRCRAVVER
jgi:hypothetical protein